MTTTQSLTDEIQGKEKIMNQVDAEQNPSGAELMFEDSTFAGCDCDYCAAITSAQNSEDEK